MCFREADSMATMAKQRKSHGNIRPPPKDPKAKQDYMITEDEDSSTSSQSPSIGRTRDLPNSIDEDKLRNWEGKILGSASEVFTFKVSLPAVVLIIAVGFYVRNNENYYEHKFAELMKYENYLEKLKTVIKKDVPSLDNRLSELNERLKPTDARIHDIQRELNTASDNLTNVEMRLQSISGTSSKLEVDLPIQQQKFTDITENLQKTDTNITNILNNIDSINNETNDIKSKLKIAFENQTILTGLLDKTTAKAEYVNATVSVVHTEMTEINKHLPTLKSMNKSVPLIMSSYHLLPLMQRSIHDLEVGVNNTESKLNDLKESSESVSKAVSSAVEQQKNIDEQVKLSDEGLTKLEQHISKTDENLTHRLTRLSEDLETSKGNILETTSQLNTDISKTEVKIGSMVTKVDEYNGKLGHFESNVESLNNDVNKMKLFEDYTGSKVRELDIQVRNLQSQNAGLFQPINVCVALAFLLIASLFYMTYYRYDNGGTQFREHERTESHSTPPFMSQRAPNILDSIQRVPVFDNKVCVVSFYSETMNLHKQLVKSALATHKRGGNIEIIQHLVRRHEDIPKIPGARYIFVFVDFNERNVILENPGQDLGDKKLVTVQAAQKLGANVFVTYVRDRGSNQLLPGNLYNQELSAFTSHQVLRGLENQQRCFSVYETFNTTQKESIVRSIS